MYEIYLTSDYTDENEWLKLILEISNLNGLFRSWKLYVKFERSVIKYYIVSRKKLPTVLSCSGAFLIKRIDTFIRIKTLIEYLYLVRNNENNLVDIYDRNESKYRQFLKQVEITFISYCKSNYLTKTKLYFEHEKGNKSKGRAIFFIPHIQLSMDFSKHTRFSYVKEGSKYLQIQKSIHMFETDERKDNILEVNTFPYSQNKYFLNIENYDFDKHSLIVGGSGTGKSKLIAQMIKNIYENKYFRHDYKIIMIDPHSSIENDIGGLDDTQVIDMKNKSSSVDLLINSSKNVSSGTEILLTVLKSVFGEEFNSKLERVLRHSIYLLLRKEMLDFENLRKLIIDTEYRNDLLRNSDDVETHIKEFFGSDFNEIKTNSYAEAISPIIALIDEMQMLPCFREKNEKNIENEIRNNFLTIFSLNQAELGEKVTKTIAGLIFGVIFQLVQRHAFLEHLILIIDEVAIVENPILKNLLSEARKYNLSIILAGQYFGQISKDLQDAIFSNVMNYYSFRISREDAMILNNQLQMEMAVKNTYHNRIKLLTEIPNRDCIVRISKNGVLIPAFRARTLDFKPIPKNKNQILMKIENTKEKRRTKILNSIGFKIGNDNSLDLKKLMESQSTSRRKIRYE